jgi:glycine cleavage system regulatory protein
VVTKTFEDLSSAIHPYGCYWLFSALSAVGAAFAIFIVPETKGKSLDEIQALFS